MVIRQRWIAFLVLYHLIFAITLVHHWGKPGSVPHWSDLWIGLALPTVQFTWSLTVGVILGPQRRVRRWYWMALLSSPVPLWMIYIATMLTHYFLGMSLALTVLIIGLGVFLLETVAGLFAGIGLHTKSLLS